MSPERFRIIRSIPKRLEYPAACYVLEIVKGRHEVMPLDEWSFQARKVGAETVCVIVAELVLRSRLEQRLIDGFDVEPCTPAARIMERLVRDGVAEKATSRRRRH